VTVPVPVPAFATVMVTGAVKVAVTATDPETLTVQVVPLVEVQPVQEAKVEPVAAVAVRVTVVPLDSLLEQVDPQLMRLSLEVTVPEPLPALVTVIPEAVTNVAVTLAAAVIATVQVVPEVEVHPVQLLKTKLVPAVATRVTVSVGAKFAVQAVPQLIEVREVESLLVLVMVELATEPVPMTVAVSLFGVAVAIGASTQSSSTLRVVVP